MEKSSKNTNHPTALEINYMRRLNVRAQKNSLVLRKLQDIPIGYFQLQNVMLIFLIISLCSVQIAIIVKKTPLYFVCSGFWVGFLLVISIFSIYYLGN